MDLEDEAGHHLGLPGRMSAPVIGTARPETVGPTTLLAAPVVSSVVCTKMILLEALILTFLVLEGLAVVVVAIDLGGNPGIGSALGMFSLHILNDVCEFFFGSWLHGHYSLKKTLMNDISFRYYSHYFT